MKDIYKSKKQLIQELEEARRQLSQKAAAVAEADATKEDSGLHHGKGTLLLIRKAIDSATDAIGLSDSEGHHVYHNRAFADLFEYTPEDLEVGGGGIAAFAVQSVARDVFGSIKSGRPWSGEVEMRAKSGRIFSLFLRADAIKDDAGKIMGLVGVFTDISERKRLEAQLRKKHDEMQLILDSIPAYVFYKDKHGKMLNINKAAAALAHVPKEKLLQRTVVDLTPETADRYNRDDMEVIRTGQPKTNIEEPLVLPDGTRWLKTDKLPIKDDEGNIAGLVGFSVDITELKSAQEQLREKEALLRTFFNSPGLICGIVELEVSDLRYITVNAAMAAMYGLTPEDASNKLASEIGTDREIVELFIDNYKKSQKNNTPVYFEYQRGIGSEMRRLFVTVTFLGLEPVRYRPRFAFVTSDITERRKAEEALRDSGEKLRLMFASMADGVVVTDIEGKIIDVNEAQLRMFGFKEKSDLIGKGGFDFLAGRERGRALADMFTVYEKGFNHGATYTVVASDGREFECELSTAMLHDSAGKPSGTVTVMRDVTERRQMEQAIRVSEERYRLLAENATDAIWTIDMGLKYTFISPAILRIVNGYTIEDLQQMRIQELLAPESFSRAVKTIEEELAREATSGIDPYRTRTVELELRNKDGSTVWTEIRASFMRDVGGNVIGVQGSTRDITERRKAEQKIRESEERYRLLAENVSDVIWMMDLDLKYQYVSPSIERMRGFTPEEFKGVPLADYMSKEAYETSAKHLIRELELEKAGGADPGRVTTIELELKRKDGSWLWTEARITFTRDKEGKATGIMGITRDISERRKMQEALRESNEKLQVIFDSIGEAVTVVELGGNIVDANKEALRLHGFDNKEAIIGKKASDMVAPADRERAVNDAIKALESAYSSGRTEYQLIDTSGREFDGEFNVAVIRDIGGKPTGFIGVARDISERKRMEKALKESGEYFKAITENSSDMVIITDKNGDMKYCSSSIERFAGYKPEELIGKSAFSFIHPGDVQRAIRDFGRAVLEKDVAVPNSFRIVHKDGTERFFDGMGKNLLDNPSIAGFIMNIRDVTERNQMEDALRNSEKKLRVMFDSMMDGIVVSDSNIKIVDVNKAVLEMTGEASKEGLIGRSALEVIRFKDQAVAMANLTKMVQEARPQEKVEYSVVFPSGKEMEIEVSTAMMQDNAGNLIGFVNAIRDVSERKKWEEILRRSEEKYRTLAEATTDIVYSIDNMGNLTFIGPQVARYDLDHEKMIGRSMFDFIYLEDREKVLIDFERTAKSGEEFPTEFRILDSKGIAHWIEEMGKLQRDSSGAVIGTTGVLRDITERKKAEEALRESETRFRNILENSQDASYRRNLKTNGYDYLSPVITNLTGYTVEEMVAMSERVVTEHIHPEEREQVKRIFSDALSGLSRTYLVEYRFMCKDGHYRWMNDLGSIMLDESGKAQFLVGALRDISERRKAEEALKKSEEKYRNLVEREKDVIVSVDLLGFMKSANSAVKMWGYTADEVLKMNFFDLIAPEWREVTATQLQARLLEKGEYVGETVAIRKDGEQRPIEYSAVVVYDEQGQYAGAQAIVRDISERKKSEEALQAKERYFRAITDLSSGAALVVNLEGNIVDVTGGLERISGYTRERTLGHSALEFIHPDDLEKAGVAFGEALRNSSKTVTFEARLKNVRGEWQWTESMITNLLEHNDVRGIVNHLVDITERKNTEEKIRNHAKRIEALYSVAQVISQSSMLDAMLNDSLDRVCSAMDTESGCIFMLDLDENALKLKAWRGVPGEAVQQFSTIALTEGGIENLVNLAGPITAIDETQDVIEPEKIKKVTVDLGRKSIAAVPFFRGKDFQGLVVVFTSKERTFSTEDLDLFKTVANEISIGINNMMLLEKTREMSVTDELTGLYNRRYFFEMLDVEMNRAGRTNHPFSLVMLDLDGFKEYNDKYGHTNGDAVLQTFSQMLKSSIRKSDLAFRYGGDEFALILPSADAERAKKIVQRARAKWQKVPLAQSKIFGGHVGFSTGIAEYPENAESPDGLIFLADAALYQAKKKGYEDKLVSELRTLSTDIMDVATQDQVYALAATVDARDPYTYGHSQRVAEITMAIGKQIGMSAEDLNKLQAAALLHDIGKVGVPDAILSKMGKPTSEEWDVIKKHCSEGARILSYVKELSSLVPIVLHHHEWYDGSGYPSGLKGMDIPSGARITSVADAYDTMVTKRPYREVISSKEACEELKHYAGVQFDPVIVDVWTKMVESEGKPGR